MTGTPYWTGLEAEPAINYWTTDYFRKLCIERHRIRARLYNPGGSIILHGRAAEVEAGINPMSDYSADIGNDFHLDLLAADDVLRKCQAQQVREFLEWCDGLSSVQAAAFTGVRPGALRKRRERFVKKQVERLNDDRLGASIGRNSGPTDPR